MNNQTTQPVIVIENTLTSHPLPGATKFEPISAKIAFQLAHEHYGSAVSHCEKNADGSYSVKAYGSWKAVIGTVGGMSAILHKLDDGTRELLQYL